ncbi:GYF domain-containing protein [Verrucomicrobiota bacterium]
MAEAHDEAGTPAEDAATWFLKIDEERSHGPVPLSTLVSWVEQGRIAPDTQLSEDKKSWVAAPELPELGMEWLVTLLNGREYGPFNSTATPHLLARGLVDATTVLRNKGTGEESPVHTLLPDAAPEEPAEEPKQRAAPPPRESDNPAQREADTQEAGARPGRCRRKAPRGSR